MSELDEIVSLVIQKTMADRMSWQFDGRGTISAKLGANIVEIQEIQQDQHYLIVVRNSNGIILTQKLFSSVNGVTATFNKIKRAALGVDAALNDIKNQLKGL